LNPRLTSALSILGAVFILGNAPIVQAGLLSDDEARKGVADIKAAQDALDARAARLEASIQSFPDLVNQMETLNQDMAALRGKLEVLGNQIESANKHSRDLYLDLDSRLKLLETATEKAAAQGQGAAAVPEGQVTAASTATAASAGATPTPIVVAPTPVGADPYSNALAAFNGGDFAGSLKQFRAFLEANPKDARAANAVYWIGTNQLSLKDYKGARATLQGLIKNYPSAAKAPDALLNLASASSALGDTASANTTLRILVAKYPNSSAAVKARARLQ
jgi:tol-pal system protein YbgF